MDNLKPVLFANVNDPRVVNRCDHKLSDILFIAFATLVCNGEDFEDMVEFATQRYEWLKKYIDLPNGIPCSDTFNRVLQRLEPKELLDSLQKDGEFLLESLSNCHICLDGKKIKGVSPKSKGNQGLYILSAWVSDQTLCVGQSKVEDKSNEIKAIPTLLDQLDLEGSVVSIDAIGCQKEIASQIAKEQADYLLSLKKNQKSTYQNVLWLFEVEKGIQSTEEWEYDHGRFETRKCTIIKLDQQCKNDFFDDWESLSTLIKIESSRQINQNKKEETRYYISNKNSSDPNDFNQLVRGHWSIENKLHWHLDVTFAEDSSRARTGNTAENLNIFRKMALKRISKMKDKISLKKRRYRASMNMEYLESVLNLRN